ncbi:SDR family NAD(P)-dependent oxidoreductase [Actinacidiphila oryziradicis]|uniref:SDR family NAD(P)-dependent oxidoreductase n=1 Tax=Actinacidiphila oryziradicis TaxID=2571141 RepID=UPI001FE670A6|nr:SDR family NAD(P)-dependent oxidoreductase [Actinacidiphila oryziradicis]
MNGQVVVVTGAARGVGALLARKLAARGARLALVGLEPPDELKAVAGAIGPDTGYWTADVSDRDAMARVAAEGVARFGRVDAVVANAGVASGGPFLDSDPAGFERVIQVNLLGSATTARAFLPALLESRGYLLQITSLAAIAPAPPDLQAHRPAPPLVLPTGEPPHRCGRHRSHGRRRHRAGPADRTGPARRRGPAGVRRTPSHPRPRRATTSTTVTARTRREDRRPGGGHRPPVPAQGEAPVPWAAMPSPPRSPARDCVPCETRSSEVDEV